MHSPPPSRNPAARQSSSYDLERVLSDARELQRAARVGARQFLLHGKNLGLLCEADDAVDAALFRRAAGALGAHVAHIRPSLSELSTASEVRRTAGLLGRLYHAVECQGMAAALVQQVGHAAGVPVYAGLASPGHPTACLVDLLDPDRSPAENRLFVLQAVLLATIA